MILPERQPKVNKAEIYRLIDAGQSQGAVSRQLHVSQGYISKLEKKRRLEAEGDPEHTNGIPAVYQSEMGGIPDSIPVIPGIPVIPEGRPEAQWRQAIESRLDVIESFIAAAQQRAHGIPVTPDSIPGIPESIPTLPLTTGTPQPTKKHSFVIALDLLDHINTYAKAHHLEIKTVLDLALRQFFAGEGER